MSNRMSYSDVQQLKNHIRQRLQEANVQNGQMNGYRPGYGAQPQYRQQGGQQPPVAYGRMARANNRAANSMSGMQQPVQSQPIQSQPMQSRPMQSQPIQSQLMQSRPVQSQPMQSQQVRHGAKHQQSVQQQAKIRPQAANNAAPPLEKQIVKKGANTQAGTHFEKYDCGHPYPGMSVRKHIKEEMGKSRNERIDNLRYAYVMSEILSQPVCKRRRRNRQSML